MKELVLLEGDRQRQKQRRHLNFYFIFILFYFILLIESRQYVFEKEARLDVSISMYLCISSTLREEITRDTPFCCSRITEDISFGSLLPPMKK